MPVLVVSDSKNKASNDIKYFNEMTTDQIHIFSSQNNSHKPGGLL